jgi:lysophospholipase L1-like esterase
MRSTKMPEIIAIGDSITEQGSQVLLKGWVALLQERHIRKRKVVNMGFGGYNTQLIREVIYKIIDSTNHPVVYTLFLGANDAVLSGYPSIPIDQYRQNLEFIVKQLNAPVVLITPPPVYGVQDRMLNHTNLFRNQVLELAQKEKLNVLDTWEFITKGDLRDGLHFNENGNIAFYQELDKVLDKMLPKIPNFIDATGNGFPDENASYWYVELSVLILFILFGLFGVGFLVYMFYSRCLKRREDDEEPLLEGAYHDN